MRYLAALLCPPLALFACQRPLSALLNFLLILTGILMAVFSLLFLLPLTISFACTAVLHAVLVVNQEDGDERHRQLMAALKAPVPPRRVDEWQLAVIFVLFVAFMVAMFMVFVPAGLAGLTALAPKEKAAAVATPAPAPPAPLASTPAVAWPPEIEGLRYEAVVEIMGQPASRDSSTGVATWKAPQAHLQDVAVTFSGGVVTKLEYVP